MNAIEFETDYKSGIIKIPDNYNIKSNSHLKIIVLYEEEIKKSKSKDILVDITNRYKEIDEDEIDNNIMRLKGLGKEIWDKIDLNQYIEQERDTWNDK